MYRLIRSQGFGTALQQQGPSMLAALFVAERWFRFHSFILEAGAFLATWGALDAAVALTLRLRRRVAGRG